MNQDENMKDGKYEEALERARKGLPINEIFPELKESEDERIRKAIGAAICGTTAETVLEANGVKLVDALSYLERQKGEVQKQFNLGVQAGREEVMYEMEKEQKPEVIDPFDDEQFRRGYEAGKHDAIREQKPAEWSEKDEEMFISCISSIEESKENRYAYRENDGDTSYDREIAWLKSRRPQPHWKPSEEQMEALMLAIEGKCAPTSYLSRRLEDLYEALANEFHVECKLDK